MLSLFLGPFTTLEKLLLQMFFPPASLFRSHTMLEHKWLCQGCWFFTDFASEDFLLHRYPMKVPVSRKRFDVHLGSQPTFIGRLLVASSFFSQERGVYVCNPSKLRMSPTRPCCSTSMYRSSIVGYSHHPIRLVCCGALLC